MTILIAVALDRESWIRIPPHGVVCRPSVYERSGWRGPLVHEKGGVLGHNAAMARFPGRSEAESTSEGAVCPESSTARLCGGPTESSGCSRRPLLDVA